MNIINIFIPDLPESVTDATIIKWHKKKGDKVQEDTILVDIETDKVILEIPSPSDGILNSIIADKGKIVLPGQVIGTLLKIGIKNEEKIIKTTNNVVNTDNNQNINLKLLEKTYSPTVRRLISMHDLRDVDIIQGTGTKNRLTRKDILNYLKNIRSNTNKKINNYDLNAYNFNTTHKNHRSIKRVKMTRLRKKISERLLSTKNNTASLTTFNEVNMQSILNLRRKYGELFKQKHGIKLGLMSFYVKAVIEALKIFPEINASIDNDEIIYYNYFDISIAISTPRGLVTPVLKNADLMSMAEIEIKIKDFSEKGKNSKLTIDDLIGGNFTITNGGVFGSLFSTPLINPPQSAILGMHAIHKRPVIVDENIEVHPMMYLALSYDHRLIDGKESVGFLLKIKEFLEDFSRIVLNI
ncbi:dihydrolipoamide succinyltransferase component of 2-oxoglutarate dehydrogenase complex [Buchnera aphidicola str. Bp (Baizongia pistaciae)]|uniref:Dihydrolipoyllysine-residue succinyltransferase component of 2-oxoglutarate dehydrogenase complex n=1 Tax=Buchnera aphidicola subsp. Baizongia pistaciae (strain Bp) TaxID=224915 RepID=ODO2_BUCBP|nr:dihydrolipoyllysine-residue succinyltransferase [Buchnera aphidicola]Q89AJ6.1 RecName: Full=Dihydrolipoyllysine-residue succinyltransferase component of 2-oxoglutarate dehydrogenase complex; AltName: Full=2-oxoglutarate dehydrogenase complex component E2; Short=OGDC-E2; AltName: Full=Dihydrolipoamide succinyltransferase component of 2-oxoglutarate dehydrogenase complex [Buchnera aphidicola str. Bp (Baizongia pistaciae)]AAO27006.1 dihydrolipoamide succinyltransferase component of 2-oxoglutarate